MLTAKTDSATILQLQELGSDGSGAPKAQSDSLLLTSYSEVKQRSDARANLLSRFASREAGQLEL